MTSNGNGQYPEKMAAGEVARAFGVDRKTVYRWAKDGLLPSTRTLGGHRRYQAADVKALTSQPYKPRPSNLRALATQPQTSPTQPLTPPGAEDWMFIAAHQGARAEAIAEAAGLSVSAVLRILREARF